MLTEQSDADPKAALPIEADPPGAARIVARVTPQSKEPVATQRGPVAASVSTVPPRPRRGRWIMALVACAALSGGGFYGWHWWTVGRFQESTDDAFLQADKVTLAPRVTGYVAQVLVSDNQTIKAGDVVARIDDRDYRVAYDSAKADVEKAQGQLDSIKASVNQQQATIEQNRAEVANTEAALTFSAQESKRYKDLLATGAGTTQRAQQAESDLEQRTAALRKARATLEASQRQVATLQALGASFQAALEGAKAKLAQARFNLDYTTIASPIDGVVGDRSVRPGQLVQAGTNLLTVVPTGRDIYLIANFKETQLGHMVEGQAVAFTVDAFGDHVFHGTLQSLAPGTGSQFALLPPENATGNFTKVVQRVPVKIMLSAGDPLVNRLRPGLSVEATVDTKDATARGGNALLVGDAAAP